MKVNIGPYVNWWGPYQIADLLQKVGVSEDRCHSIGAWLADTKLTDICEWIYSKRNRRVKVKIDRWDTWNADETLAYIILPMLKQLKETKHGSPNVDDNDVPYELSSFAAPAKTNEWDTDNNIHKRWDWVMSEMIWAFEQRLIDWEGQFHSGKIDTVMAPVDKDGNDVPEDEAEFFEMRRGPNDTHKFDKDGYTKHVERMENGFRLFGKYYQSLWD